MPGSVHLSKRALLDRSRSGCRPTPTRASKHWPPGWNSFSTNRATTILPCTRPTGGRCAWSWISSTRHSPAERPPRDRRADLVVAARNLDVDHRKRLLARRLREDPQELAERSLRSLLFAASVQTSEFLSDGLPRL